MMTLKSFSKTDNSLTVVVFDGSDNMVLRTNSGQPDWPKALLALSTNNIPRLVDACSVGRTVERYTDCNVEVKDGNVFFKGRALYGLDVTRLLEYIRDNVPYLRLLRFLEKKQANPSYRSINELYKFLEHREMTLTERGTIIGYKGVSDNYYSIMGNTATIVTSGTVDSGGHILNAVGEKVRCDRSCVCDDYKQGCSPGLHIGSLAYAKGWGPRVMIVEFDPADVVSVPDECECQKLRACAYDVIGEFKGELVTEKVEVSSEPNPEDDGEDEPTCDDPNCFLCHPENEDEDPSPDAVESADAYDSGYQLGEKEGRAHKARKHYATDLDDNLLSDMERDYISGYNDGYRHGRYGK